VRSARRLRRRAVGETRLSHKLGVTVTGRWVEPKRNFGCMVASPTAPRTARATPWGSRRFAA
jgi:hypothetical protein